jgi:hypothetical protein
METIEITTIEENGGKNLDERMKDSETETSTA